MIEKYAYDKKNHTQLIVKTQTHCTSTTVVTAVAAAASSANILLLQQYTYIHKN